MSSSRLVSTARATSVAARPGSLATPTLSELQLLSNGRYHVMVTNTGSGYSRWKSLALTRWREDATCDNWGLFCYIRDLSSGHYWSITDQPILRPPECRGDFRGGPSVISTSRSRYPSEDRHRGVPHGRCGIAPGEHHESLGRVQDAGRHELHGDCPGGSGRGHRPSGLREALCGDRDSARCSDNPLQAPAPHPTGADSMDVSSGHFSRNPSRGHLL